MRRLWVTTVGALCVLAVAIALTACGPSRQDAASEANIACQTHGGVNTKNQNGFFYTDHSEGEWNATCADGTVVAGD